jgi:hypothetical protein
VSGLSKGIGRSLARVRVLDLREPVPRLVGITSPAVRHLCIYLTDMINAMRPHNIYFCNSRYFRGEFTQSHVSAEKFDKEYVYGIR